MELRPVLAHDDVSGNDVLAAVTLHAEPLGIAVTTVADRAAAFFMSHFSPLNVDCVNTKARVILAMPTHLTGFGTLTILENVDFRRAVLRKHSCRNRCAFDGRLTDHRTVAVAD